MKNLIIAILIVSVFFTSCQKAPVIIIPAHSSELVKLAASEVKRYTYLVNDVIPLISEKMISEESTGNIILIASINSGLVKNLPLNSGFADSVRNLSNDGFGLKTITDGKRKILLITGNTDLGTLYGAYQFAEKLGIRFYAHGDVIPDGKIKFSIPEISEIYSPLFETRGLQPFHDFPEGPDWWNSDDYKSIFSQMVKMKMNFFGLHTYPEGNAGPEPTVWIGLKDDINPDGTVKFSYPARYFTTTGDTPWGYNLRKTSDYSFGTGNLFESDSYGSELMKGFSPVGPIADRHGYLPEYEWKIEPQLQITDDGWNSMMNRTGKFFNDVFSYGRSLGVRICVGTETPLIVPGKVKQHLIDIGTDTTERKLRFQLYEGIFERIKLSYPIDYYWFWTPEDWTWRGNNQKNLAQTRLDLEAAISAAESVKAPFLLATCGWVLGPVQERAMFDKFLPESWSMSCINREVGFSPVEPDFAKVVNRPKWAIPWLEDDPGLILPQLWAGRMRRDAADALAYGCTGLIGIHWRTQILSPNISALAQAAWNQKEWNKDFGKKLLPDEAIQKSKDPQRDLPSLDFYQDWCNANFGKETAKKTAEIFVSLDGTKRGSKATHIPRPGDWSGPGGIKPDSVLWDERKPDYKFVDEFEKLSFSVKGKANLERYTYWLNNFKYLRAVGKFACSTGEINRLLAKVKKDTIGDRTGYLKIFIDIRIRQMEEFEEIISYLMNTLNTNGELGTLANWQQHNYAQYIYIPGKEIEKLLKQNLPASCWLPDKIITVNRIIVPTLRTTLRSGEDLRLKILLPMNEFKSAKLFWRNIGEQKYSTINLENINRAVWQAVIPSARIQESFEYYIEVNSKTGPVRYPVTAPERDQTVVVY